MKKYFPSSNIILRIIIIVIVSWAMYGVPYPKQWPFASIINSHPIGSSIASIAIPVGFFLSVFGGFYLLDKYEGWRKK